MLQQLKYLFLSLLVIGIWGNLGTILRMQIDDGNLFILSVVIILQLALGYLSFFKEKQKVVGIIIFLIATYLIALLTFGFFFRMAWGG